MVSQVCRLDLWVLVCRVPEAVMAVWVLVQAVLWVVQVEYASLVNSKAPVINSSNSKALVLAFVPTLVSPLFLVVFVQVLVVLRNHSSSRLQAWVAFVVEMLHRVESLLTLLRRVQEAMVATSLVKMLVTLDPKAHMHLDPMACL